MKCPHGYEFLENVTHDAAAHVFRARRANDGRQVLLKHLKKIMPEHTAHAELQHELNVLKRLSMGGVPQPLGLEDVDKDLFLILDDFKGRALHSESGFATEHLSTFFEVAIRLATLVGELHQRQVVHAGLRPSSILCHEVTGEVCLLNFHRSLLLDRAREVMPTPPGLADQMRYLSPEQTGRMNRMVDYRTDFYSLGATLYELLVGRPPFVSDDPIELIYAHMARQPPSPQDFKPTLPKPLCDVILKLLSKSPEQRYQGAYGLGADLTRCRDEWASQGHIVPFDLGQHDIPNRFRISGKCYGRERSLTRLREVFEWAALGEPQACLVFGEAGCGKSRLVGELMEPVTRARSPFLEVRFERFHSRIAFTDIISGLNLLVRRMLTENEASIARWRERLEEMVGDLRGVLVHYLPELTVILGEQEVPRDTRGLFRNTIMRFLVALSQSERPLVIFMDNMQWADSATTDLLHDLVADGKMRHLLIIAAQRSGEPDDSGAAPLLMERMAQDGLEVTRLPLGNLDRADLNRMIAHSLARYQEEVAPLGEAIYCKTLGNPFFTVELLKTLHQRGLIRFDFERGRWIWDLDAIAGVDMASNVARIMEQRIRVMPEATRRMLELGACVGSWFDLDRLSRIMDCTPKELLEPCRNAVAANLIVAREGSLYLLHLSAGQWVDEAVLARASFQFSHPRIREAAYALVPADLKAEAHLRLGRMLLLRNQMGKDHPHLMEIVDHLNKGSTALEQEHERLQLAKLNLAAAAHQTSVGAFDIATGYLELASYHLPTDAAEQHFRLTFDLHLSRVRNALSLGHIRRAHDYFVVFEGWQLESEQDRLAVLELGVQVFTALRQYDVAVKLGLKALHMLGMPLKDQGKTRTFRELVKVKWQKRKLRTQDILNKPDLEDERVRQALQLLMGTSIPAFSVNPELCTLLVLIGVNLSLRFGNCDAAALAYVQYGAVLGTVLKDWDAGLAFGQLAIKLCRRFHNGSIRARVLQRFAQYNHRGYHFRRNLDYFAEGLRAAREAGDMAAADACSVGHMHTGWLCGLPLEQQLALVSQYERHVISQHEPSGYAQLLRAWASAMKHGMSRDHLLAISPVELPQALRSLEAHFLLLAMQTHYLLGDYDTALARADRLANLVAARNPVGLVWAEFHFYHALILLAVLRDEPARKGEERFNVLPRLRRELERLARQCPENFRARFALMAACQAELEGSVHQASEYYDEALRSAAEGGFGLLEALARQLAGQHYARRGLHSTARIFLKDAAACWHGWGGEHLARAILNNKDLGLMTPVSLPSASSSDLLQSSQMDLTVMLDAALALSSEIDLSRLLQKIMGLLMENAGAQRGLLLVEAEGVWRIEAEGDLERKSIVVRQGEPLEQCRRLCRPLARFVIRTRERLVLEDAASHGPFASDAYLTEKGVRSVLCMPALDRGRLAAVIYLENNATSGAFNHERLQLLQVLAAQVAVSLQNARLYSRLEERGKSLSQKVEEKTRALTMANRELSSKCQDLVKMQTSMVNREKMAAIGAMVTELAHDVKDPLTLIHSMATLSSQAVRQLVGWLRDQEFFSHCDDELVDWLADLPGNLKLIKDQSVRIDNILNHMLSFPEKDGQTPEVIELTGLLRRFGDLALRGRRAERPDENFKLRMEIEEGPLKVEVVPIQMGRALVHCLNHAFDACGTSQTDGSEVVLSCRRGSESVLIDVRHPRVERKALGKLPLGLDIVRDIVERGYGGKLSLTNEESWSTLSMCLPDRFRRDSEEEPEPVL